MSANNTHPSGSGSGSNSGPSSSASSPTKRSHRHQPNFLSLPPPNRSTSPLSRSSSRPTSPSPVFTTPPLHLTVRFSAALPDLHLDILTPQQTTIATLKHLIRARLAADAKSSPAADSASRARLRFIHAGKILPSNAALSTVLKPLPPPPPSSSPSSADPKGKGKGIEGGRPQQRVYVNCSIGDELTPEELALEAATASSSSTASPQKIQLDTGHGLGVRSTASPASSHGSVLPSQPPPPPRPRGFDRLLATGFTPAEVNQLRLQFRSIQAARHTPDTMPSPDSLRGMEDAWIDSNAGGSSGSMGGSSGAASRTGDGEDGGGGGATEDAFGLNAVVDALIKGMFIGFVFPLGAMGWLLREEGIWPKRMQVFVWLGFMLSLSVGMIRALGGEG
ncbi:DUF2407 C-terminal domain-containing protein [Echria macrotheca]|uniref:DUF2407 C-terminal domain-containing protein n=1 Tax=Echria macrotheca TaxID=438768 RepID=A0AAJ0FFB9_9PEZI|nr:DUF2407 C-terminal domain-containing protein [Echria macrotheca]